MTKVRYVENAISKWLTIYFLFDLFILHILRFFSKEGSQGISFLHIFLYHLFCYVCQPQ